MIPTRLVRLRQPSITMAAATVEIRPETTMRSDNSLAAFAAKQHGDEWSVKQHSRPTAATRTSSSTATNFRLASTGNSCHR